MTASIQAIQDASEPPASDGHFSVSLSDGCNAYAPTSDTTIGYTLAGSAVNGSDYSALSGTVTIPAGQSSADITVHPLPETNPESDKTVDVTLTAGGGYG